VGFSFAIGSLSSVLSSLDAKAAKLKEKLSMLDDIRREYKIPYDLYRRLRLALNYDHSKNAEAACGPQSRALSGDALRARQVHPVLPP
jgi:hypothetical protein